MLPRERGNKTTPSPNYIRMNENLKKLYDNLIGSYDLPDYETFALDMQDTVKSKKLYDNLVGSYDLPDYDTFLGDMGVSKKKDETFLPTVENLQKDYQGRSGDFSVVPPASTSPSDEPPLPDESKATLEKLSPEMEEVKKRNPGINLKELNYETTLPKTHDMEGLVDYASKRFALYDKRSAERVEQYNKDIKQLQLDAKTDDELNTGAAALYKAVKSDLDKLEKEQTQDNYQYIHPDHIKEIQDEVKKIIDTPGETTEQKTILLENLRKYYSDTYKNLGGGSEAVDGELNVVIGRASMLEGSEASTFALKTHALKTKDTIIGSQERLKKEFAAKYDWPAMGTTPQDEGAPVYSSNEQRIAYEKLQSELRKLNQAEKNIDDALKVPDQSKGAGLEAFRRSLSDIASSGMATTAEEIYTAAAAERQANGTATEGDKALIDAYGQLKSLDSIASTEVSRYRRTQSTAASIAYMETFLLTGGMGKFALSTAEKAAAAILKKKLQNTLLRTAEKQIVKRIIQPIIEGGISMVGRVPVSPGTYKNIAEARLILTQEDGKFVVDSDLMPSMIQAVGQGVKASAIDIFSESLGGMFALPNWKILNKAIHPNIQRAFREVGLNGLPGEFSEEIWNAILAGDDWMNKEYLTDLLITVPAMMGGFAVLASPRAAAQMKWRTDSKAVIDKFGRNGVAEIRNLIETKDFDGLTNKVSELTKVEGVTDADVANLIKYSGSLVQSKTEQEMIATGEQKPVEGQGTIAEIAQVDQPAEVAGEQKPAEPKATPIQETQENKAITLPDTEVLDNGDVMYNNPSTFEKPAPEVKEQVRAEINRLNSLSKGQKVLIVEDNGPLHVEAFTKRPRLRGIHMKGDNRSYIHIDRVSTIEQAQTTWIHEAMVHGGVERMFKTKQEYEAHMLGVVKNLGGRNSALDAIQLLGGNRIGYMSETDASLGEEYLAFMAKRVVSAVDLSADKVLDPVQLGVWQRFVKAIKDSLAKYFGVALDLSDADVANLIIDATKVARSEKGKAKDAVFKGRTSEAPARMEVSDEQRKAAAITPQTSGRYADLTEDKDGNLTFFHYSPKKLDTIEPNMYGTAAHGKTSKEELAGLSMVGGSFLYPTNDYGEGGIANGVVHIVKARPEEVYDLQKDPLKFFDEAKRRFREARGEDQAFNPIAQTAWVMQVAHDNGYKIGVATDRNGKLRAQIARPVKVDETFTEQERVGGGTKTTQWNNYRSNAVKGWRAKSKSESVHPRYTNEWIAKAESRLGNTPMTRDEIKTLLETGEYAILTGENPMNKFQDEKDNAASNKAAEKWLTENGFSFIPVVGKYDGKGELSYIVPGMTIADARRAQDALKQEGIAHSSGLLKSDGKTMNPRIAGQVDYPDVTTVAKNDYVSILKDNEGNPLVFSVQYDINKDSVVKVGNAQEAIIAVAKSLGLTFPGVKVIVGKDLTETRNQIYKALKDVGGSEKAIQSVVQGFTDLEAGQTIFSKGKPIAVVINEGAANTRTAGHEMWEVILNDAFKSSPEQLGLFVDAIDKRLRKSGYIDIANELKDFAAMYGSDLQFSEFLAEFGGYLTSGGLDLTNLTAKEKTLLDHIKEIINQFAEALIGARVFLKEATPENIMDFMVTVSQKMARGESVAEHLVEGEAPIGAEGLAAVRQSISIVKGVETMKKYGLLPGKNTVRHVGEALEARQRKVYGVIDKNDRSVGAEKKISGWMVAEIEYYLDLCERNNKNSGRGWYGELYQEALDIFSEAFPRLKTDQNARDIFTLLSAITSDGQKVMANFKLAAQAYQAWEKTGFVPDRLKAIRSKSVTINLGNINDLLISYNGDIAKIKEALLKTDRVSNINAELRKRGMTEMKWPADFTAPVAAGILGPKLGMYYANLSGMEKYPTLDRWWSRMFNRYRGTLIPEIKKGYKGGKWIGLDRFKRLRKSTSWTDEETILATHTFYNTYKDKAFKRGTVTEKAANTIYKNVYIELNDAPFNTSDRGFMYRAIDRAVNSLNKKGYDITIADAQAVLWYYEKNLYKELGAKSIDGISYADAARESIKKYHETNNTFDYKIKKNEDVDTVEGADDVIEEDDIEIRRQLRGNKNLATDIKNIIQKRIDKAYAIGLGDERLKHVGEAAQNQKRINKAHDIGLGEGNIAGELAGKEIQKKEDARDEKSRNVEVRKMYRGMSRFISETLKQNPFAKELSNAQVRTIVNAARRVNEKNVDEFMDLVDRLVDNREYAKAIDDARQNQRAIRRRVNDGRYYGQETPAVADFASMQIRAIDFSIEDLNKYNNVAELLLAGRVPVAGIKALRAFIPPLISETKVVGLRKKIESIDGVVSFGEAMAELNSIEITSIAGYKRVLALTEMMMDRVAQLGMDEETMVKMENEIDAFSAATEERVGELTEELAEERAAIIEEARELKADVVRTAFPEETTDEEWEEVEKFKDISEKDLESMTPKQIMLYYNIMIGLSEGFVNKEMYSFIQEVDTRTRQSAFETVRTFIQTGYAKIRAQGDALFKHNLTKPIAKWIDPLRKDVSQLINMINLNKLNLIDQKLLGWYHEKVGPMYKSFVAPLASMASKMDYAINSATNRYWSAARKVAEEDRMLLGVIMVEQDFRSNPIVLEDGQGYTWETLPAGEQKDITRWTIDTLAGMVKYDTIELGKLRAKLILGEDGNIDIEANLKSMFKDPKIKALYDVSRALLDEQKGKVKVATAMRGGVYEGEGPLYLPRFNREYHGPSKNNRYEIEDIKATYSPYRAIRKRAKSTYSRNHTRNANEYNLDNIMGVFIADVNRDYYLSRIMTSINTSLQRAIDNLSVDEKDAKKVAMALQEGLVERIKTEFGERGGPRILSKAISWQRTFALAQIERFFKELSVNELRYFIRNPGRYVPFMNDKRWSQVAILQGSPIALKQLTKWQEAEVDIGDAYAGPVERAATLLYTAADTVIGRVMYAREFSDAFKKETGVKFDIDAYISDRKYRVDNKQALANADATAMSEIETLFNTQTWVTAPSKHKYIPFINSKGVSKKSAAAKVLGYMQSFNFSETAETLNAILTLVRAGAGPKAKLRAVRLLGNMMLTNYMYMSLGGLMLTVLRAAFDDDKDIDEAVTAYFSPENQWDMFCGSAATLGMGRYGNVFRPLLTLVLGAATYADPKQKTSFGKAASAVIKASDLTMNIRPIGPKDRLTLIGIADNVGLVYGAIVADLYRSGLSVFDLGKMVAEDGFDSLSLEQKETWLALSTLNQAVGYLYPNPASPFIDRAIRLTAQGKGPSYIITPGKEFSTINGLDALKVYGIEGVRGIMSDEITAYTSGNYGAGNGALKLAPKQLSEYEQVAKAKFEKSLADYVVENEADIVIDSENKNLTFDRKEAVEGEITKLFSDAKTQARFELFEFKGFHDNPTYQRALKAGAITKSITTLSRTVNGEEVDLLKGFPERAVEVNKIYMRGFLDAFEKEFPSDAYVRGSKNNDEFDETVKRIAAEQAKIARDAVASKVVNEN
jgi:hypothetical protein